MKVLIDVLPDQLPPRFQDLVDPAKPLRHPERFTATPREGGFLSWLILVFCLALTALLSVGVVRQVLAMTAGRSYALHQLVLGLVFIMPLLWWAARQVRFIRIGRAQAADMAAGRYRRGVFFESDAALCFDGRVCTLIPRSAVLRVDRRSSSTESGARALGTYIDFKGPDGREHERFVPGPGWYGVAAVWQETGQPPRRR